MNYVERVADLVAKRDVLRDMVTKMEREMQRPSSIVIGSVNIGWPDHAGVVEQGIMATYTALNDMLTQIEEILQNTEDALSGEPAQEQWAAGLMVQPEEATPYAEGEPVDEESGSDHQAEESKE